jgi:hypothetical protein
MANIEEANEIMPIIVMQIWPKMAKMQLDEAKKDYQN